MIITESKNINYKSDFDFILKLQRLNTEGKYEDVGFPDYNFTIILYTNSFRKYLVKYNKDAKKDDEKYINCKKFKNNQIQVICNNHRLPKGLLHIQIYAELPNNDYPDGTKLLVCDSDTNIRLTDGCSDLDIEDITFIAPYVKGEKGDQGETGAQGITPQLKIENNYWYVSYDDNKLWTQLGKATGDKGEKGDKGDPLTWQEMTEEQKKEVINSAVEEIQQEQIITLGNTSDTNDYNDVF